MIAEYNYDVKELRQEMENMKQVITSTFDDELIAGTIDAKKTFCNLKFSNPKKSLSISKSLFLLNVGNINI